MKCGAWLLACVLLASAATDPAQAIFEHAVQALAAGDYPAAERGFLEVLRVQPNHVGAIGNLGIVYARMNRNDQAITEYQRALRLSPNDESILLNLGLVYLKEERHEYALPYFQRVIALDPQNRKARQLADVCRLYMGKVALAIQDLERLRADDPGDGQLLFLLGFAYLKNGDMKTAREYLSQMLEAAGPDQAEFLMGKASYEALNLQQAEKSFLRVLQLNPDFPGIHVELGKVYSGEHRAGDAIREFQTALKKNPADADANYYLGCELVREDRFEEGIPYLEKATKLAPDSYAAYVYLGKAKLHLGQAGEAVALLRKAVELNPDNANAQYTLGRALEMTHQKAAAAKAFEKARRLMAESNAQLEADMQAGR